MGDGVIYADSVKPFTDIIYFLLSRRFEMVRQKGDALQLHHYRAHRLLRVADGSGQHFSRSIERGHDCA